MQFASKRNGKCQKCNVSVCQEKRLISLSAQQGDINTGKKVKLEIPIEQKIAGMTKFYPTP